MLYTSSSWGFLDKHSHNAVAEQKKVGGNNNDSQHHMMMKHSNEIENIACDLFDLTGHVQEPIDCFKRG